MAEIAWTVEAQRWLEDIFDYIAADRLIYRIVPSAQLFQVISLTAQDYRRR